MEVKKMRSTEQMKILEILRLYELDQFTYEQIGQHASAVNKLISIIKKRSQ